MWGRERGLTKVSAAYPPSFYMHLDDPASHLEMIEGLESRYKIEDCTLQDDLWNLPGLQDLCQQEGSREDREADPI